jgi:hypothetical protein
LYRREQTLFVSYTWSRNAAVEKKSDPGMDEPESKNVVRRTTENQLAVRGSKKIANATAAYGAYLQTKPDSYIYEKQFASRYNKHGKVIVGAHTQRTVMHTRSDRGRNFKQTDGSRKRRMAMGRNIVYGGRLIPVLGYGFVIHNTLSGEVDPGQSRDMDMMGRTYQGATLLSIAQIGSHYQTGGSTINLLTAGRYL